MNGNYREINPAGLLLVTCTILVDVVIFVIVGTATLEIYVSLQLWHRVLYSHHISKKCHGLWQTNQEDIPYGSYPVEMLSHTMLHFIRQ